MRLPFLKTAGYRRKQVLAREIAAGYIQQVGDTVDDASKIPERTYDKLLLRIAHDYYVRKAQRYAQLANSLRLYFKTESRLTQVLEKISVRTS